MFVLQTIRTFAVRSSIDVPTLKLAVRIKAFSNWSGSVDTSVMSSMNAEISMVGNSIDSVSNIGCKNAQNIE